MVCHFIKHGSRSNNFMEVPNKCEWVSFNYQNLINIYIKYKLIELFEWELFYYGENCAELPESYRIALRVYNERKRYYILLVIMYNFAMYDFKS